MEYKQRDQGRVRQPEPLLPVLSPAQQLYQRKIFQGYAQEQEAAPAREQAQQRQALPGQVQALTRLAETGSAHVQRQQQRVAPILQAAELRQQDDLAVQRTQDQLNTVQRSVQASSKTLSAYGLAPAGPLDVVQLQREEDRQAARAPVSPLPLSPVQRQALMQHATDEIGSALTRDARYLPAAGRADVAHAAVQRFAQQGLDKETLRSVMVQRAPDENTRESVTQLLTAQRRQETQAQEDKEERGLLLGHHQLQRQLQDAQAEHDGQQGQSLSERVQARVAAGQPLPPEVRRQLERGLNADLSRVRIHDDSEADKLAKSIQAVAFTSGQDIFFRAGKYQPNTQTGMALLMHEGTHTVQQARGQAKPGIDADPGLEQEAVANEGKTGELVKAESPPTGQQQSVQHSQSRAAVQRKAADNPDGKAGAAALHTLVEKYGTDVQVTGSAATLLLGVENAANLRLGSSRRLVTDKGLWGGMTYKSLAGDGFNNPDTKRKTEQFRTELLASLTRLRAAGTLDAALGSYQVQYGKSFSAVLGEQVRDPNLRQQFLALMPVPISAATLTKDAFIEQLAFGYSYNTESADALNSERHERAHRSDPHAILQAFGFRAGPPIAGHWGFQMRIFFPIPGKAKYPNPVVTFRGTEGMSVDLKGNPEGTLDSVVGDLAPAGVGYNQYKHNHALIRLNVLAAAAHGKVIMAGHSLGGALAQIAATEFRDQTAELVSFQGAGVSQQDLDKVTKHNQGHPKDPLNSRFYRVDGDVVPSSGQSMLPGSVNYFDLVQRPAGSKAPYAGAKLSGDAIDIDRVAVGHTMPILTTYIRGQKSKDGLLAILAQSGVHGDDAGKEVGMVHGGSYTTANDPRMNLEARRVTTPVSALKGLGHYEAVFYNQIAYNTLLSKVEDMAQSKKYKKDTEFFAAVAIYFSKLTSTDRLAMSQDDIELGKQLRIRPVMTDLSRPMEETTHTKPSPFSEMIEKGVLTTSDTKRLITQNLETIWNSWHPEKMP